MKNITILRSYLFVALIGITVPIYSQAQSEKFNLSKEQFKKQNNQLSVSMDFTIDQMKVKGNEMIILTPILKSNENGVDSLQLPPVVVAGKLRNKLLNRANSLGKDLPFSEKPQTIIVKKGNKSQVVNYSASVPYRAWMSDASFSVAKTISGCANCFSSAESELVVQRFLPSPAVRSYQLTFIVPEVEPVKNRGERHTATFNYIVDRYELLRDYKNNAAEFDQVDKVISEIQSNKDLQITEFSIAGYASPEGGYEHNRILSKNRANSFAEYLVSNFGVARNKFTVEGHGEDWGGLRSAISTSSTIDKQAILNIIDNTSNPDARDAELLKLSNGETYRTLLHNYYPPLRRTEYAIAYIVRAFNVEEARKIIKVNPKLLSLNEMYLVAKSYPADSKEFREVFDIAVRLYPESEIAIINSAAADIEGRNLDVAIQRMRKIENKPSTWNNLGVAYTLKGDVEKGKEYFSKSASNGDKDALANLKKLEEVIDGGE